MRINELIKELERIKNEKGNLLVSIYRSESGDDYSFYPEGNYYSDVNLEVVNNTNTKLKNGQSEIIIVNEPYYLAIG